jgi:hypothetical protein
MTPGVAYRDCGQCSWVESYMITSAVSRCCTCMLCCLAKEYCIWELELCICLQTCNDSQDWMLAQSVSVRSSTTAHKYLRLSLERQGDEDERNKSGSKN